MDGARLARLIADLYNVVDGLDQMFADCKRRFTPDGHLIGSIGEVVARHIYNLDLETSSKAGYDATFPATGKTVQVKTTSIDSISVREAESYADYLLVLKLDRKTGSRKFMPVRFQILLQVRNPTNAATIPLRSLHCKISRSIRLCKARVWKA